MKNYISENNDYAVCFDEKMIKLNGTMSLKELVDFTITHGLDFSEVYISSGGDPYLPTEIDWSADLTD